MILSRALTEAVCRSRRCRERNFTSFEIGAGSVTLSVIGALHELGCSESGGGGFGVDPKFSLLKLHGSALPSCTFVAFD
jgi:hypothetical protein